jgi:hypothetical protein
MKNVAILMFSIVTVLSGCAIDHDRTDVGFGLAYHSDVKRNDDGSWQAAVETSLMRGRIGGAKALATEDAVNKCRSENKAMKVVKDETDSHLWLNGVARLTFRCE